MKQYWYLTLLSFWMVACSTPAPTSPDTAPAASPNRRALIRNAMRVGTWLFVYHTRDTASVGLLRGHLETIARQQPMGKRIFVRSWTETSPESLGAGPVAFFGQIPGADTLFTGWTNYGPRDVLHVQYAPNPHAVAGRPTLAAYYLSADTEALVTSLDAEYDDYSGFFWPRWAYDLRRADGRREYGVFGDTAWTIDTTQTISMSGATVSLVADDGLKVLAFDGAVVDESLDWVKQVVRKVATVNRDAYKGVKLSLPEIHVYPTIEKIGLRRGGMQPVQYEPEKHRLHLVPSFLTPEKLTYDIELWRAFMRHGNGQDDLLQTYFWAAWLQRRSVDELGYASGFRRKTAIARSISSRGFPGPVRGGDRLPDHFSPLLAEFLALARAETIPPPGDETGFDPQDYRFPDAAALVSVITRPSGAELAGGVYARNCSAPFPLAGMTFAHEGYRVYNGYGGERIKPSLDALAKLNVDALGVVPYTFMRDPRRPGWLSIPQNAGSENDAATAYSLRQAKQRGWYTLLKPQIWVGGGSWPGEIDFDTQDEWEEWFGYYTHWIMHYAVLAEWERVDGLCIGTELVQTTTKHPAKWRAIIQDVRRVFGGDITYAANWGEDFDNLSFGDELDFLGLNAYYPISNRQEPSPEALIAGVEDWLTPALRKAERLGKPLVLTEIGFRSTTTPWVNPYAEAGGRAPDPEAQRRAYAALTQAVGKTDLAGMFIWKWPSYLDYDHRGGGTGFTPADKPAAEVLGSFYRGWSGTADKR